MTLADLARSLPVSYRQVHHWASIGLLPDVRPDGSSPTSRQVRHLQTMAHLVVAGFKASSASWFAALLLDTDEVDIGGGLVIRRTS